VKKLRKSVNICQSYRKNKSVSFFMDHSVQQPFHGHLDFVWVSWHHKGKTKTSLDFLEKETVIGNGISWAICKSASWSRQISMPASYHSVFYRPDALPATQPTA